MDVKIIEGFHLPVVKTNKDKTKTWYEQSAFIDLGGPFPMEFKINIETPVNAHPIGNDYVLTKESFKVNQYGNLEIDRWNIGLERKAQAQQLKKVGS